MKNKKIILKKKKKKAAGLMYSASLHIFSVLKRSGTNANEAGFVLTAL